MQTKLVAVLGLAAWIINPVSAGRWLIKPIFYNESQPILDPATFNISNYDPTYWNVTRLPSLPAHVKARNIEMDRQIMSSPNELGARDNTSCHDTGNEDDHPGYCVGSDEDGYCNLAIRIPVIPSPFRDNRSSGWLYTRTCDRVVGCKLKNYRGSYWWSIFSELKYTTDCHDNNNSYPFMKYADYSCGYWCWAWSWVYEDPEEQGYSVYIYRVAFPCNQP
ncbi:hypothetical protein QBC46DRAFT_338792 [Diplogelasinospora grovesii]|uniref:Secreted protein n=1 Tax=Diplogelasinospora grovesii TaxID=303347 RepID=A0AAN6NDY6_9PEZI|nr:hypothetical protein QBC46DRAFT_338792 [Diplogelasinospora grovesii]